MLIWCSTRLLLLLHYELYLIFSTSSPSTGEFDRFSFPSLHLSGGSAIQWHQSTHTAKASRSLTGELSPSYRRTDPSRERRPNTDTQDVSTSHEGDVPSPAERVTQLRHSSTERVTLLQHSSTERVTQLRHSSTERVPLLKHSSAERNPLLKRFSTETLHLTRMSSLRHFFTEMCYYNQCSDFLRNSLPHATINWCHWPDFKNVIPHIFLWAEIISQGTTF